MPIYCKLLTMCFVFNVLIIRKQPYIRDFIHRPTWLDLYRLILCCSRQQTIIAGGYGFTGIKQERLPHLGQPFLFVDLILSQNQIISISRIR